MNKAQIQKSLAKFLPAPLVLLKSIWSWRCLLGKISTINKFECNVNCTMKISSIDINCLIVPTKLLFSNGMSQLCIMKLKIRLYWLLLELGLFQTNTEQVILRAKWIRNQQKSLRNLSMKLFVSSCIGFKSENNLNRWSTQKASLQTFGNAF